jgi:hypothetical protein
MLAALVKMKHGRGSLSRCFTVGLARRIISPVARLLAKPERKI